MRIIIRYLLKVKQSLTLCSIFKFYFKAKPKIGHFTLLNYWTTKILTGKKDEVIKSYSKTESAVLNGFEARRRNDFSPGLGSKNLKSPLLL